MNNSITRVLFWLLLLLVSAEAATLAGLRARVNAIIKDKANFIMSSGAKDSLINGAQLEFAAMFPIKIDTVIIVLDSAERIETMPANFAGIVFSVHKFNRSFTEIKYIAGDSVPEVNSDVPQYYTLREKMIIIYPPPMQSDSLFIFYSATPDSLLTDNTECTIQDWLEEPLILLICAKILYAADLRLDLQALFMRDFYQEAERMTRTKVERQQP